MLRNAVDGGWVLNFPEKNYEGVISEGVGGCQFFRKTPLRNT